ncbi:HAD family hydrolase [Granulosicoccus antarcticus]|uniref:Calcium-transporting ATPase 1 n=1 Tax=Granulosicoccus antarcticus IMCC3135 TaxID=1192854 RepID=A0A2Z2P0D8_9GAMM|nr:HAD family hydrolase [Granulosicoccus antarcticus]ASJ73637.1 Calcium-transporting ATPase 1 [Granulosicoccus antarcticus IMCC3135]
MSDEALRTLAVARRNVAADAKVPTDAAEEAASFEQNLEYLGTVGIIDPPRKEAAVAIDQARQAGIRVIMITGDHPRTAVRIAAGLGIVDVGADPADAGPVLARWTDRAG